jgi:hypothetical protein
MVCQQIRLQAADEGLRDSLIRITMGDFKVGVNTGV